MAKINIEIDLDWLGEDESLDDAVKTQVMAAVEERVVRSVMQNVEKITTDKINERVTLEIASSLRSKIEALISMPRSITDSYGRVQRDNVTLDMMLTERMEQILTNKKCLTDKGEFTSDSYNAKLTIVEWFGNKNLDAFVSSRVTALAAQTKKEIEVLVENRIKGAVAENLTKLIMENSTALSLKTG